MNERPVAGEAKTYIEGTHITGRTQLLAAIEHTMHIHQIPSMWGPIA